MYARSPAPNGAGEFVCPPVNLARCGGRLFVLVRNGGSSCPAFAGRHGEMNSLDGEGPAPDSSIQGIDRMNQNKFSLLEQSLFWFNNRRYAATSKGPSTFGIIFRDGHKYLVDGVRMDATHFEFRISDIKCLPCGKNAELKDFEKVGGILKKELTRRGLMIVMRN